MSEYTKQKPETIQQMFGSIAKQYDKTNSVLSFCMHKLWNRQLVKAIKQPKQFADLCCGTGEIALTYMSEAKFPCQAYLIDFCPEMLLYAREKVRKSNFSHHTIQYIEGDVQKIPLELESVESATMAYGIRNVQNPKKCIEEVFRILKSGGTFGILELTQPQNPFLRFGHTIYLRTVLPILGKFLTSNKQAYQYLCNSIHTFVKPKDLEKIMLESGFKKVEIHPLHGGIATIILAHKA